MTGWRVFGVAPTGCQFFTNYTCCVQAHQPEEFALQSPTGTGEGAADDSGSRQHLLHGPLLALALLLGQQPQLAANTTSGRSVAPPCAGRGLGLES